MQKLVILVTCLVMLAAMQATAFAQTQELGFYAAARAGAGVAQADDLDFNTAGEGFEIDVDDGTDVVPVVGLAFGWDFYRSSEFPMRVELEWTHMNNADFSWEGSGELYGATDTERFTAQVDADTLMLNGYYDFHNSTMFTPFVQAGLGLAIVKTRINRYQVTYGADWGTEKETRVNFAAGAGAGLGIALTERLTLDAAYRFAWLGPVGMRLELGAPLEAEADVWRHDILLGLRYAF